MSQGGCLYWIKITFGQDLVTLREYKIWLFWCFCRRRDDREFICKSVLFLLFREYTRTVFWLKKRNTRQINSWKSNKNVPENDGNERAMMSAAKPVYWIAVTLYDYVIFVLCKYRDRSLHSTECGSPLLATTARKVKQESPQPARLLLSIAAGQLGSGSSSSSLWMERVGRDRPARLLDSITKGHGPIATVLLHILAAVDALYSPSAVVVSLSQSCPFKRCIDVWLFCCVPLPCHQVIMGEKNQGLAEQLARRQAQLSSSFTLLKSRVLSRLRRI